MHPFVNNAIGKPLSKLLMILNIVFAISSSEVKDHLDFTFHNHVNSGEISAMKAGIIKNHFLMGEIKLHYEIEEVDALVDAYNAITNTPATTTTKAKNMVEQLFTYMVNNKCQYGLLTSIKSSWGFHCKDGKNLEISQKFGKDDCIKVFISSAFSAKNCEKMIISKSTGNPITHDLNIDENNTDDPNPDSDNSKNKPFGKSASNQNTNTNSSTSSSSSNTQTNSGNNSSKKNNTNKNINSSNTILKSVDHMGNYDKYLKEDPHF